MPIQIHVLSELEVFFFFLIIKIKNACFQGSHCVCVGDSMVDMVMVMCGCVNEVCMAVTWCGEGCVGVGVCVFGGVGGWMSEFWTSDIVYMLILTISMSAVCLSQFGPPQKKKPGLSEFWKNTLQLYYH